MVALLNWMPVGAVTASVPPHCGIVALLTVSPAGIASVNPTPVSETVFAAGLVIVKVKDEVPFTAMVVGLNAFAIDGGATTVTEAEAVAPLPPSVDVMLPVTLFWTPAAVPVTLTENEQVVPAASAAPERLTTPVPAVAVIVPPPQDPLNPLGVETVNPAGSVSLKRDAMQRGRRVGIRKTERQASRAIQRNRGRAK